MHFAHLLAVNLPPVHVVNGLLRVSAVLVLDVRKATGQVDSLVHRQVDRLRTHAHTHAGQMRDGWQLSSNYN